MSLTITVASDTLTPSLRRGLAAAQHPRMVWLAGLTQIVSITKRSFTDSSMRIAPWADKRTFTRDKYGKITAGTGGSSKLILKGTLLSSIRVVQFDDKGGSVGSDRVYAAIHQLGGVIRPKSATALVFTVGGIKIRAKKVTMPARPFFPFTPDGRLAPQHAGSVLRTMDLAMKKQLGIS